MEQKQEKLYALLNEKLDHTEEISDEEILVEIDKLIWEEAKGQYMPLSEKITLRQQLFNGIRRLDILQELLEDESVTEIMHCCSVPWFQLLCWCVKRGLTRQACHLCRI